MPHLDCDDLVPLRLVLRLHTSLSLSSCGCPTVSDPIDNGISVQFSTLPLVDTWVIGNVRQSGCASPWRFLVDARSSMTVSSTVRVWAISACQPLKLDLRWARAPLDSVRLLLRKLFRMKAITSDELCGIMVKHVTMRNMNKERKAVKEIGCDGMWEQLNLRAITVVELYG